LASPGSAKNALASARTRAQVVRHAVAGDQEEAHALQRGVDLGGDGRATRLVSTEPGGQVDHGH
jgi:hypothetical protein